MATETRQKTLLPWDGAGPAVQDGPSRRFGSQELLNHLRGRSGIANPDPTVENIMLKQRPSGIPAERADLLCGKRNARQFCACRLRGQAPVHIFICACRRLAGFSL